MSSVFEQILARVQTVLLGTTTAAQQVFRAREAAYGEDELPAINITRGSVETSQHAERIHRHRIEFVLEFHAAGDSWESDTDALHMQAHNLLLADSWLSSTVRGFLCISTSPSIVEAEGFIAGRLTATYQVQVLTRPGDLTRVIN